MPVGVVTSPVDVLSELSRVYVALLPHQLSTGCVAIGPSRQAPPPEGLQPCGFDRSSTGTDDRRQHDQLEGAGQRPGAALHPGPEDPPPVSGLRRSQDLPEQEGRGAAEEAAGAAQEAGPADPGAAGPPQGGLTLTPNPDPGAAGPPQGGLRHVGGEQKPEPEPIRSTSS